MKWPQFFGLILLLALTGCSPYDPKCANLLGSGRYCLQSTTVVTAFDVQQKVTLLRGSQSDTLIVELEVDPSGLRMVGVTPFGHKLIELNYDNQTVKASTTPDTRLSPTLLVALLQMALWPQASVREGLQTPLTLEDKGTQRRIMHGSNPVLTITHDNAPPPYRQLQMTLHAADLELRIETLDDAAVMDNAP